MESLDFEYTDVVLLHVQESGKEFGSPEEKRTGQEISKHEAPSS